MAGAEGHYLPAHQLPDQIATLTHVRSLIARLFTRAEQNDVQVGNFGFAIRVMIDWMAGLLRRSKGSPMTEHLRRTTGFPLFTIVAAKKGLSANRSHQNGHRRCRAFQDSRSGARAQRVPSDKIMMEICSEKLGRTGSSPSALWKLRALYCRVRGPSYSAAGTGVVKPRSPSWEGRSAIQRPAAKRVLMPF